MSDSYYERPYESGYCPYCHADDEDAIETRDDDGILAWRCPYCGEVYTESLGHAEMVREGREDARLGAAGL